MKTRKHNQPRMAEVQIFSRQRYEGWLQFIEGKWVFCRDSALRVTPIAWHCSPDQFQEMNPDWTYLTLRETPEGCQVFNGCNRLGTIQFSSQTGDWISHVGSQEHHFNYRYEAIALVLNYPEIPRKAIAC